MTTTVVEAFEITNGPSRQELVDAFLHAYSKSDQQNVIFTGNLVQNGTRLPNVRLTARVTGLRHEDETGHILRVDIITVSGRTLCWRYTLSYDTITRYGYVQLYPWPSNAP